MRKGKLVFFSGKMGSGKTTYAKSLSKGPKTIYLSEDDILSSFYPSNINSIEDYVTYSKQIKPYILSLVKQLTENGLDVVMDFPGNTLKQREWFKKLIQVCQVDNRLIYLKIADDICIRRILKRRDDEPNRHKFDNEEMFLRIIKFFQEPTREEGFNLEIIEKEGF